LIFPFYSLQIISLAPELHWEFSMHTSTNIYSYYIIQSKILVVVLV
jgi:hypothetical protein